MAAHRLWLVLIVGSCCCRGATSTMMMNATSTSSTSTSTSTSGSTLQHPGGVGPASCSANVGCEHLVGDCCPTSYTGTFLDCCPEEDTPASCSAHAAGCAGLTGDCCPSSPNGQDLYCCYQNRAVHRRREYTFYGHPRPAGRTINYASYHSSTGQHSELRSPDGSQRQYTYARNGTYQFDMIYFATNGQIVNANDYVSGERKFYLTIDAASDAPPCTEILLQLDSLPLAASDNYPTGRHSRYWGLYTPSTQRVEFTFLDRPDQKVADTAITHIALFFEPGTYASGTYQYSFLDSMVSCDTSTPTTTQAAAASLPSPPAPVVTYPIPTPAPVVGYGSSSGETAPTAGVDYPTQYPVVMKAGYPTASYPPPPTPSPTKRPVSAATTVYPPPPTTPPPTHYPTTYPTYHPTYSPTKHPQVTYAVGGGSLPVQYDGVVTPAPVSAPVVVVGSMSVGVPFGSMAGRQLVRNNINHHNEQYDLQYVDGYRSSYDHVVAGGNNNNNMAPAAAADDSRDVAAADVADVAAAAAADVVGTKRQLSYGTDDTGDQCLPPPVNQCPARHVGVACSGRSEDCQNPECMATPDCSGRMVESFQALENRNSETVGVSAGFTPSLWITSFWFLLLPVWLTGVELL